MKKNLLLSAIVFVVFSTVSIAQKKEAPLTFVRNEARIQKYHEREELNQMRKGDLIKLYLQRIDAVIDILPNLAFATNANVTMESVGIPVNKENKEALQDNKIASREYSNGNKEFLKQMLPYSDTRDLISAILFYESTLKSLFTYNEYKSN